MKTYKWQRRQAKQEKNKSRMIGGKNRPEINAIQSERSSGRLVNKLTKKIDCINCGAGFVVKKKKREIVCPLCGYKQ